jgi:hypothetical protein
VRAHAERENEVGEKRVGRSVTRREDRQRSGGDAANHALGNAEAPSVEFFELAHLVASSKCNTLLQKMNTASARRYGDPPTDWQKNSRRWAIKRFARLAAVFQVPPAQQRKSGIKRDGKFGTRSTATLIL